MCNLINTHTHTNTHTCPYQGARHQTGEAKDLHSNESQHLSEGTEIARLRRRFSFILQQALSFRTRHHFCRQKVALASTRHLRSQGPAFVHAHCTEGVTGSEQREGANGFGGWVGVGGGNGGGNGGGGGGEDGDVNGDGDRNGEGTGTRVEASERTQNGSVDGSGDGSRDGAGTGTRTGVGTRGRA